MKIKSKSMFAISFLGMVLTFSILANETYVNNVFSFLGPTSSLLSTTNNENQSKDNEGELAQGWKDSFDLDACEFSSVGSNNYFILEPGYNAVLESPDKTDSSQLIITVLNETKSVNGIETRVVEEKETEDGELKEISRNYFAICIPSNDVFYFGEDVNMYEKGNVTNHEGSWLAGIDSAKPGWIMPGNPQVGMKYYQEMASGVAEDRAEILSIDSSISTPSGDYDKVLKIEESNPIEEGVLEYKYFAPQVGLVQDEELILVSYSGVD